MYHAFKDEDGTEYGSFETFHYGGDDPADTRDPRLESGFYWWACFPGCLADGEPMGPFKTEPEAVDSAMEVSA